MSDTYWAAKPGDELVMDAYKRVEERYSARSLERGYYERITKLYSYYYGIADDATAFGISTGGQANELSLIYVNFVRYLIQHVLSLVNGDRVAYSAVPTDNDASSREKAQLAEGVLQACVRTHRLERLFFVASEHAMIGQEGFMSVRWDPQAGEEKRVDELGNIMREGDIKYGVHSIFDVTRPENVPGGCGHWRILREWANKYDIAAEHPEIADEILSLSGDLWSRIYHGLRKSWGSTDDDIIPVYTLYHDRRPALPEGRELRFLSPSIYLSDGPLGYDKIPIYRLAASDILGTDYGYSPANDLLAPVDAMSALLGVALSNQLAYGVQNLVSSGGGQASIRNLGNGLQVIDTQGGTLTPLPPPQTPAEVFRCIEMYQQFMVLLMGQNDMSLGQIQSESRLSASAMSMMEQKAIQYSSNFMAAMARLKEDVGTATIRTFQLYASEERMLRDEGEGKAGRVLMFKGDDFNAVHRMTVEIGNAMIQTPTMRYNIAEILTQNQILKSPEEVGDYLVSGNIKRFTDPGSSELINIQYENQMLSRGDVPMAVMTEDPVLHIRHHRCVLHSPEAKANPQIVEAVQAHILQHMELAHQTPPDLAAALDHTPIAVPTAAMPPPEAMPPPPQGEAAPPPGAEPMPVAA